MKVGQIQTLKVARISDFGLYLSDEEGQEVLLPNRFVSLKNAIGDEIEVVFDGKVALSYPPQVFSVSSIKIVA